MVNTIQDGFGTVEYGTKVEKRYYLPEDTMKNIHYIEVSCGACQKVGVDNKKNEIVLKLDTRHVGARDGINNMIHKTVTVWLDKDVHQFIPGPDLMMTDNPKKDRIVYILTGVVTK